MVVHPKQADHAGWVADLLREEPLLLVKVQAALSKEAPTARALLVDVLRFLHLIAYYDRRLTPSLPVDQGWHEFILFTRQYARFCHTHFSRFIHHHPGGNEEENQRSFQKTLQLYILHWGPPDEAIWGRQATTLYEEARCGSCLGQP